MELLKCPKSVCKSIYKQTKDMSLKELTRQNIKCETCGVWLIKDTDYADKTYNRISNFWAVKFNEWLYK